MQLNQAIAKFRWYGLSVANRIAQLDIAAAPQCHKYHILHLTIQSHAPTLLRSRHEILDVVAAFLHLVRS